MLPAPRPRSAIRVLRTWALAVSAALVLAACSAAEDSAALTRSVESAVRPTSPAAPEDDDRGPAFPDGWRPEPLRWGLCPVPSGDECAELAVPLDWDDPAGPTITLVLSRTAARGDRIGSLVTNPGGPGASGLEFLAQQPFPEGIASRFDVVSWDPRGVGTSTAVTCDDGVDTLMSLDPEPDDAAEQQRLEEAAQQVAASCARSDAELLPHLGTADVARDLEAIRLALDEGLLNYVGFSYGTSIGQAYAEMFPGHVRAMVLDAVVDPALGYEEFLIEQAVAFERSFERNAQACARAGRSACGVEDLRDAYDTVLAATEREPLGPPGAEAGPAEVLIGSVLTSYGEQGWRSLGPALAAALEGDGSMLRYLADAYRDFGGYTAYAAVACIDAAPPRGLEAYRAFAARAAAAAPRFGAAVANELLPCATWPVEAVGAPRAIRAPGTPPILVVGNTGDAATPYENAVAVAERLTAGVLVTADVEGHGATTSNACVAGHVEAYLVRLDVPEADPNCT